MEKNNNVNSITHTSTALFRYQWDKIINTFKKHQVLKNTKMEDVLTFFEYFNKYKNVDIMEVFDAFDIGVDKAYKKYNPINNGNTKNIINMKNIIKILKTKNTYEDSIATLLYLDKELSIFTINTKNKINKLITD